MSPTNSHAPTNNTEAAGRPHQQVIPCHGKASSHSTRRQNGSKQPARHAGRPRACLTIDLAVSRGELTEAAWEWIAPLLPGTDERNRPWRDHRQVVSGVLWRLGTGAPWRDLPERYGPRQTVYERFARWEADRTRASLLQHVQAREDAVGAVQWTVSVDSTINRAHQHAAGARKRGPCGDEMENSPSSVADQALRRSRGGLTTKAHLAVDGRVPPLGVIVTPGNVNYLTVFDMFLDAARVPRPSSGRPRRRCHSR
jgi:transposase